MSLPVVSFIKAASHHLSVGEPYTGALSFAWKKTSQNNKMYCRSCRVLEFQINLELRHFCSTLHMTNQVFTDKEKIRTFRWFCWSRGIKNFQNSASIDSFLKFKTSNIKIIRTWGQCGAFSSGHFKSTFWFSELNSQQASTISCEQNEVVR